MKPPLALAVTVLVTLAVPASAHGSSITLSIGPDPTAEVPLAITVSGVADGRGELTVGSTDVDGTCSGYDSDAMSGRGVGPGAFSETATTLVERPGTHVLCAEFSGIERGTSAQAAVPYVARPPHVSLAVDGPRRVAFGARVVMSVRGDLEAGRWVFSALLPPGSSCRGDRDILGRIGPGGATLAAGPFAFEYTASPRRLGTWHLCLSTRRYVIDDEPQVLAEQDVRVTTACTRASRALSRARDSWRGLSRWQRLHGRGPDARLRARGRAIRRARARRAEHCDA